MRVLIAGANGQLGSDLLRTTPSAFTATAINRDQMDVLDVDKIAEVLDNQNFDALINCTSYHKVDEVERNATQAFTINAHAVKKMAEACNRKRAIFVHISTDYVFDGNAISPYCPNDRIGPINVYGASKAMGENLARLTHEDTLIVRVASLFGVAGASGKGGNFVETIIRVAKEKRHLEIVHDIFMSPTYTLDAANAIWALLQKKSSAGIYHIVNSAKASWCEFATSIVKLAKIDAEVVPIKAKAYPYVAQRPMNTALDNFSAPVAMSHWHSALERYLQEKGHIG